jgi:hypothetical protein
LIPKFASEGAAAAGELRNRDTRRVLMLTTARTPA